MLDGYLWREKKRETIDRNRLIENALFVSRIMYMFGRQLKSPISPLELIEPLLKAKKTGENKSRRKEDEEYFRRAFPEVFKELDRQKRLKD